MMKRGLLLAVAGGFFYLCGQGVSAQAQTAPSPLSAEQKSAFRAAMVDATVTSAVVMDAARASTQSTPADLGAFGNAIVAAIKDGSCQAVAPTSSSESASESSSNWQIFGDKCPITLTDDVKYTNTSSDPNKVSLAMKGTATFEIKDSKLAAMHDFQAMHLAMDGTVSSNSSYTSDIHLNGPIKFTSLGEAGVDGSMKYEGSNFWVVETFHFKDFTAVLEAQSDSNGVTYKLNGETLSAEDAKLFGLPEKPSSSSP